MKLKFMVLRKKRIFAFILTLLIVLIFCATYFPVWTSATPKIAKTIVIDAGHGGIDGGAVGKTTGVSESFLNLQYAKTLGKIFQEFGFNVVLTREDMNGLYSPTASNKKRSEMQNREKIIENSNPDLVLSIHMNSFSTLKTRGAYVFYAEGSKSGESLACSISNQLVKNIDFSHQTAKVGDYYILNCCDCPSALIECGFLSNPDEELLLQDENYINKFCYSVFCGVLLYFK